MYGLGMWRRPEPQGVAAKASASSSRTAAAVEPGVWSAPSVATLLRRCDTVTCPEPRGPLAAAVSGQLSSVDYVLALACEARSVLAFPLPDDLWSGGGFPLPVPWASHAPTSPPWALLVFHSLSSSSFQRQLRLLHHRLRSASCPGVLRHSRRPVLLNRRRPSTRAHFASRSVHGTRTLSSPSTSRLLTQHGHGRVGSSAW